MILMVENMMAMSILVGGYEEYRSFTGKFMREEKIEVRLIGLFNCQLQE